MATILDFIEYHALAANSGINTLINLFRWAFGFGTIILLDRLLVDELIKFNYFILHGRSATALLEHGWAKIGYLTGLSDTVRHPAIIKK